MGKKLLKSTALFLALSIIGAISTGCSGANADTAGGRQVTVGETENIMIMDSSTTEETSWEIFTDDTIRNNTHNIFDGTIGQTEVRMRISRKDNSLTAAYITRADDENFFEGEMKNPAEFELKDDEGGYLKGRIQDGNINGTGMILGESIEFVMNLDTFFPIGYDYDNYYSGVAANNCSSKEVEKFAQQIKDSMHNKEEFLELFTYPLEIRIEGEAIAINSKEEMAKQYDFLISEEHFREQIENMYTKYLFLTYEGICVENGIIWFMKDNNDNYKIWALNVRKLEESELPDVFPLEFVFCSGAGAWRTTIVVNQDGSFSGEYLDSDMGDSGDGHPKGTQYICSFSGKRRG